MILRKWEIVFVVLLLLLVGLVTYWAIGRVRLREDLALVQIGLTDALLAAKKCLEAGGTVQDPSLGRPGRVFVCSRQEISGEVYPDLQKISPHHYFYQYSPLKGECKILSECRRQDIFPTFGVLLKGSSVLRCDIRKGFCYTVQN